MTNLKDIKFIYEAYLDIFNKKDTSEIDKQTLQKVLTHITSEKFKSFLNDKIKNATTKTDFYFIIQDIADQFSNFSGGVGKDSLPEDLAKEIHTLSKKYHMI